MSDYKDQLIIDKLVTGRIALLLKHPFFGNLATRLKLVNAGRLVSDSRYRWQTLSSITPSLYIHLHPKKQSSCVGHEVLHNVFEHMLVRIGDRDPQTLEHSGGLCR